MPTGKQKTNSLSESFVVDGDIFIRQDMAIKAIYENNFKNLIIQFPTTLKMML